MGAAPLDFAQAASASAALALGHGAPARAPGPAALGFASPADGRAGLQLGSHDAPAVDGALLAVDARLPGLGAPLLLHVPAPTARVAVDGALPGLGAGPLLRAGVRAGVDSALPGLGAGPAVRYDSRAARPVVGARTSAWQAADSGAPAGAHIAQQSTVAQPHGLQSQYQQARDASKSIAHRLPPVLRAQPLARRSRAQDAQRLQARAGFAAQGARALPLLRAARFAAARRCQARPRFAQQNATRQHQARRAPWRAACPLRQQQRSSAQSAAAQPRALQSAYERAMPAPPGRSLRPDTRPDPAPPCYDPATLARLVFEQAFTGDGRLVFVCRRAGGVNPPGPGAIIPIQKVYIVQNNITLARVDTGAPLHALAFSASLDAGSWTWQWSATLHASAEPHLARQAGGDPPEVLATINGQPLRLVIERVQLNQQFLPQKRFSVSGRGRAAILASPYAPALQHGGQSTARTAQQLAAEVLQINGVGIGWAIDWQLPDWTVPPGVWVHHGAYIDALTDIASAVGAYVQPHPTDAVLRILARYPQAPWDWPAQSVAVQIAADVVQTIGTEYLDKPAYNGVHVGGTTAGVFGPVVRTGTVGDVQAPQATHPLITDATAQLLRGRAELSDTGRQRRVQLSMPVLEAGGGIITPGKLVQVGTGAQALRGIVRGVALEWGLPRLRQNLELEVHE